MVIPQVQVDAVRRFIRHPSDIPMNFSVDQSSTTKQQLRDVSCGGLCFNSDLPVLLGKNVHIQIPLQPPPFEADGVVAWCRPEGDHFAVGVQFDCDSTAYSVRMVEQVCHIEHYRSEVHFIEGRELSSEEAAQEWVSKYASEFPATN